MKIASSTPDGRTHLFTEEDVDLADLPNDEPVPARMMMTDGGGPPRIQKTAELEAAGVPGGGEIEIGEVHELTAQRFAD